MIPVALTVVIAIIGACLVVASGVLVYKLHVNKTRLLHEKEDIESIEPVRKLRVKRGRVVSTTSTILTAGHRLSKLSASRFSSRPVSIRTVDLEEDIRAYRHDYPPLPRDSDGNIIGIPPDRKPLYPINESSDQIQLLSKVYEPKDRLSRHLHSPEPVTDIIESSWKTYNGHREDNDVLSSPIGPKPRLDLDCESSNVQFPQPTKSKSREDLRRTSMKSHSRGSSYPKSPKLPKPVPEVALPETPKTPSHKTMHIPLKNIDEDSLYNLPASQQPSISASARPSQNDVQDQQDHFVSPQNSISRITSVCISDIESRPSRTVSRRGRSTGDSRSSSRSRHRSRSHHRVRKWPPPPIIILAPNVASMKSATSSEADTEAETASFLSSPTQSEATSAMSLNRLSGRKNTRLSAQTFASSELSPTFSVAPVLRVPLYAGKSPRGGQVKVVSNKTKTAKGPERPSVLRAQTAPFLNQDGSSWPPRDICSMLKEAHTIAQSLDPVTPPPTGPPSVVAKSQKSTQTRQSSSTNVRWDAKISDAQQGSGSTKEHSEAHSNVRRPMSQARSLSGNIMLSTAQTRAYGERNIPGSSSSRRSRYEHLMEEKRRSSPAKSLSARESRHQKDAVVSSTDKPARPSPPTRKGSLPARLPDEFGPPDPKVLSKILGLTPKSPATETPQAPLSAPLSPQAGGSSRRTHNGLNTPPAATKNVRGVGNEPQRQKSSAKTQVLSGGKKAGISVTTKELETELERVSTDLKLMGSGFAETGIRRGAISTTDVAA